MAAHLTVAGAFFRVRTFILSQTGSFMFPLRQSPPSAASFHFTFFLLLCASVGAQSALVHHFYTALVCPGTSSLPFSSASSFPLPSLLCCLRFLMCPLDEISLFLFIGFVLAVCVFLPYSVFNALLLDTTPLYVPAVVERDPKSSSSSGSSFCLPLCPGARRLLGGQPRLQRFFLSFLVFLPRKVLFFFL